MSRIDGISFVPTDGVRRESAADSLKTVIETESGQIILTISPARVELPEEGEVTFYKPFPPFAEISTMRGAKYFSVEEPCCVKVTLPSGVLKIVTK